MGQWEEVIRALSGHGQYRFTEEYTVKNGVCSIHSWGYH